MDETGALQQIYAKYEPPPQNCESLIGKPVGMNQSAPGFLLLAFGFVLVLIVFIVEITWKYASEKKEEKDTKRLSTGWLF